MGINQSCLHASGSSILNQNPQVSKLELVLGFESGSHLCHMSYWASRSSNVASLNNEEWMSKKNSKVPVIHLDNLDKYCTRGFIDCMNIQEEEYTERADVILE